MNANLLAGLFLSILVLSVGAAPPHFTAAAILAGALLGAGLARWRA